MAARDDLKKIIEAGMTQQHDLNELLSGQVWVCLAESKLPHSYVCAELFLGTPILRSTWID